MIFISENTLDMSVLFLPWFKANQHLSTPQRLLTPHPSQVGWKEESGEKDNIHGLR